MSKLTLNAYMAAVEKKLENPVTKRLMQFGSMAPNAKRLRDETGMVQARDLVRTSAKNLFLATEGRDDFAKSVYNFSASDSGYSTVADVRTVGAIDVTILVLANSLIPFVCVDRALDTPDSTVYYNNLVSISADGVGGVDKGEVVGGNFSAQNLKVDLGSTRVETVPSVTADQEVKFLSKVIPGTLRVELKDKDGVVLVGRDFGADGIVFFKDAKAGTVAGDVTGTIDYATGEVKFGGLTVGQAMSAQAERDLTAEPNGANVLRVTPDWVPTMLHTEPKIIVVEDNIQNKMYMKKIQAMAGSNRDLSDDTFARAKNTVIEYQNMLVLNAIKAASPAPSSTVDFSTYDDSKFVATKADRIQLFIGSLQARFLARTNVNATTILTGAYGVTLLRSVTGVWVDNPDVPEGANGLAGYFLGLPVFRHNGINNATPTVCDFYLTCKLPDNSSGTAVFGEFLPLTSTGSVGSFRMPLKTADGFFAQNGVKVICPDLIMHGQAILPASMFSGSLF